MKFKTMIGNHELDQTSSDSNLLDGVEGNPLGQVACEDLMDFILTLAGFFKALHHVLQDPTNCGPEWTLSPVSNGRSGLQPMVGAVCVHSVRTVRRLTVSWVLFAV